MFRVNSFLRFAGKRGKHWTLAPSSLVVTRVVILEEVVVKAAHARHGHMAVVAWRLHANVSQNCIFLIRYYLFRVNRIAGR